MKPVSWVIPLGTGSRYNNIELRFALRSITTHARNLGTIYIIGTDPGFIHWGPQIKHIPYTQQQQYCYSHAQAQMQLAAAIPGIGPYFIWSADDVFLLRPFSPSQHIILHQGITAAHQQNFHSALAQALGWQPHNYAVHAPQSIVVADFYNLQHHRPPVGPYIHQRITDLKISRTMGIQHLRQLIAGKPYFSIADHTPSQPQTIELLKSHFPTPAFFEI